MKERLQALAAEQKHNKYYFAKWSQIEAMLPEVVKIGRKIP